MSIQENVRLVRSLLDDSIKSEPWRINELLAPDYVHHVAGQAVWFGPDDYRVAFDEWLTGFADIRAEIEDLVASDDKVVVRVTWRGTHTGVMAGYPPTGKVVTVTCIVIYQLAEGRIVADWEEWDSKGFLEQLSGEG